MTPKRRNNNGGEDASSRSLSFGRSGVAPKRREDAFPVPAVGEESADAAAAADADGARLLLRRRRRQRQRRLASRTAARSHDAPDGEAASADATAIGPLFSRRLGTARATYSPEPSQCHSTNSDNGNGYERSPDPSSAPPFQRERHSKNPSSVLSRGRDFTCERSKSDLCHGGGLRDLVYRSSIRIMVRPEREILVIQRSASENRVSNGSAGGGCGARVGGGEGGQDEISANGANAADGSGAAGGRKKSRKESIGLIQKSMAKDNFR